MPQNQTSSTELQPRVFAVRWENGFCVLLDQTKLPKEEVYLNCTRYDEVIDAMKTLSVRGAPALGVAGAYACALAIQQALQLPLLRRKDFLEQAFLELENARPTAVNLKWAIDQMRAYVCSSSEISSSVFEDVLTAARKLHEDDIRCNRLIAEYGAKSLPERGTVLTCCNTGDLATGGIGTAFGVLREGFRQGKITHVYACETRPVLQGLRLTSWELEKSGIPFTVVCDNMVASLMHEGKVGCVVTGADRIVANGDVANKIGTYQIAVLAHYHRIPFLVAAPFSTFDLEKISGSEIPIEERHENEVLGILGANRPAFQLSTHNPAFDVTPHHLISKIISDRGVVDRPNVETVRTLFSLNQKF